MNQELYEAVQRLGDALAPQHSPGTHMTCAEAESVAYVLKLVGRSGIAQSVIFWHADGMYEHSVPEHAALRELQRGDYGNPAAWDAAEAIVEELPRG